MDRQQKPDDRKRREDTRDHKPRYDRDRSRSPPQKDRRDDRRRDRSPPRGPKRPAQDRPDRNQHQQRANSGTPPPSKPADKRQPLDRRSNNAAPKGRPDTKQPDTRMENGVEDDDSEAEMQRLMGFKGFRSTKNTKVPGNDKNWAVHKAKKTEYRQYMNRVGGFNRPLSPSRA